MCDRGKPGGGSRFRAMRPAIFGRHFGKFHHQWVDRGAPGSGARAGPSRRGVRSPEAMVKHRCNGTAFAKKCPWVRRDSEVYRFCKRREISGGRFFAQRRETSTDRQHRPFPLLIKSASPYVPSRPIPSNAEGSAERPGRWPSKRMLHAGNRGKNCGWTVPKMTPIQLIGLLCDGRYYFGNRNVSEKRQEFRYANPRV